MLSRRRKNESLIEGGIRSEVERSLAHTQDVRASQCYCAECGEA